MNEGFNIEDEDGEPTAPFWMTTFSDMVTLLLTFFVLIVAMSEVEVKKFQEALSYFQGHIGILENESVTSITRHVVSDANAREKAERYEMLLQYLQEKDLLDKVQVGLTDEGIHVVITDSIMFASGAATLIEPSRTILQIISGVVAEGVEHVEVEGHTDDRPIATAQYPSNWELSAARAASVVRFMLEQEVKLAPTQYTATGYGEFRPLAPNDTPENRAKNRRVEILFSWKEEPADAIPYLETLKLPRVDSPQVAQDDE